MAKPELKAEIKTRLPDGQREALERIADARQLGLSDIIREALREYLLRQSKRKAAA